MKKLALAISLALILTGCATQRIPFPEAELAGVNISGDLTLTGELFVIDQMEEKQVGSEQEITLEPVSSYSDQWYQVQYLESKPIKKADPRYKKYVMRTKTDKEGKFSFKSVGPGEYYLSGIIMWRALDCSANWVQTKVPVSNKITLNGMDKVSTVKMTKPFESPTEICDVFNQGDWEKENDIWSVD